MTPAPRPLRQARTRRPLRAAVVLVALAAAAPGAARTWPRPREPVPALAVRAERAERAYAARGMPIFCGGPRGRYVALTFDDGPGVYTHLALRILRAASAHATFFVVGRNLAVWPGFLRAEETLGAVGDHTWTHPFLPGLDAAAAHAQLAETQRAIEQRVHRPVLLFRPPYGGRDPKVDAAAQSLGMVEVLWSVDSLDWHGADWEQIAANVVRGVRAGSIVLMHENRGQTIRALKFVLLPELRALHWRLVSVPDLLALDPPTVRQLREGIAGCGASATGSSRRPVRPGVAARARPRSRRESRRRGVGAPGAR
jgi:peptidoglycan/xylan/chitin deacetylase (PgdA/CDA1 family)